MIFRGTMFFNVPQSLRGFSEPGELGKPNGIEAAPRAGMLEHVEGFGMMGAIPGNHTLR